MNKISAKLRLAKNDMFKQIDNPYNTYVGYWCFAAAAIVKLKNLDDSSFRDNDYYPKDMLQYI